MVRCLKIKKNYGNTSMDFLKENKWLNLEYRIGKTKNYLLLPLTKGAKSKKILEKFKGEITNRELPKSKKTYPSDLKKELEDVIPKSKINQVNKSYDLIGDIAVIEIPDEIKKLEKSIAWTLYRNHPNISSVARKDSKFSGKFRIRKIKNLCGKKRTSTVHKESGVKLKLDLNKVYFSPRLGAERIRVSNKVKPTERILVMFSGISPYPLVIEKKQPKVKIIYAVELNPAAYKFAKENIKINRSKKVVPVLGDVRKITKKFKSKFDRIIMVLPKQAHTFMKEALSVSKKGTIIHLYQFYDEKNIPKKVERDIKKLSMNLNRKLKLLKINKCGAYSPGRFRTCIDLKVLD